jgi:hypothetical protein
MVHALFLKAPDDDLCAAEFHGFCPIQAQGARPPAPTRLNRRVDAGLGAGPGRLIGRLHALS